jgi:hypothetical protein
VLGLENPGADQFEGVHGELHSARVPVAWRGSDCIPLRGDQRALTIATL